MPRRSGSKGGRRDTPLQWIFATGRGAACKRSLSRRLEAGVLPILHLEQEERGVVYHATVLANLEKGPLGTEVPEGTEWQTAYDHTAGNMAGSDPEEVDAEARTAAEQCRNQPVCWLRIRISNTSDHPQYAW